MENDDRTEQMKLNTKDIKRYTETLDRGKLYMDQPLGFDIVTNDRIGTADVNAVVNFAQTKPKPGTWQQIVANSNSKCMHYKSRSWKN